MYPMPKVNFRATTGDFRGALYYGKVLQGYFLKNSVHNIPVGRLPWLGVFKVGRKLL